MLLELGYVETSYNICSALSASVIDLHDYFSEQAEIVKWNRLLLDLSSNRYNSDVVL